MASGRGLLCCIVLVASDVVATVSLRNAGSCLCGPRHSCAFVRKSVRLRRVSELRIAEERPETNDSLSHRVSSPERYADALGLSSVDELQRIQESRRIAVEELDRRLRSAPTGPHRHAILCEHRIRHGKHPFVCPACWSYLPVCICNARRDNKPVRNRIALPFDGELLFWTHHDEWGSVSNTGSVLSMALHNARMVMKGYAPHDAYFERLLHDALRRNDTHIAVLWTQSRDVERRATREDRDTRIDAHPYTSSVSNVARSLSSATDNRRLVLVAVEGTWRNARRMVSKIHPHILRVAIGPTDMFWRNTTISSSATTSVNNSTVSPSIISPLRRQSGSTNLCTAEAVVAALVGLGMPQDEGHGLLQLVQLKIDLVRRYQGKPAS